MAPREKSQLKRGRESAGNDNDLSKKPRRSERLSQRIDSSPDQLKTPIIRNSQQLPSPVTNQAESSELYKEPTVEPPEGRPSQVRHRTPEDTIPSQDQGFSSPPQDTQAFAASQFVNPDAALSDEVEDEVKEGKRSTCPRSDTTAGVKTVKQKASALQQEESFETAKVKGVPSGDDTVAILEDLSSNGTFVNEAIVGRNKRRELQEQDEIAVLDKARFIFRYPRSRTSSAFLQQYTLLEKLGKGHFAEVFLCVEKSTGQRYAVKIFTKQPGMEDRSKTEGLQQEIAVLMGVSHPNVLCLKDTFNERNAVYLVLELAPEGELFNFIVMKQKLTEDEARKLFIQLFQGIKYLHDRNIVHRDIKPENILLVDKDLHVKLADFGLAKIIGEESFTTTLCGTPSYVAPEILAEGRHRKYTKAVDVWSLGVVLYICLCGFPPFSDELYTRDFPYTLSQQIKSGRFDYPSPYWDSVGDPALDLIDHMLVVEAEKRYTVDQCLEHPWLTQKPVGVSDSTDGLVAGIGGLEVHRRGVVRERTLLSSINSIQIVNKVPLSPSQENSTVNVYKKNATAVAGRANAKPQEARPDDQRNAQEFLKMGGKGDQELFADDAGSFYSKAEKETALATGKGKAKGKAKGR
ncbi:putative checkpoint kinase 2-like protein [Eutypa lata UCREL1]|uniref:Putative checkpoint kinase 2-like protein n=1 Tax=Eutypa lata (strain UCR-EL1) TaxID=1287681 RepID=M7SQS2_EUTLA|nr:putative checkpoint kinase 2-like protein [Eutypa lata UCREL1]